ncbi:ABC transporter substrate-binding protein [Gloeocapsopsis dulcis]|uniref:Ferrichrome ABC transporter substrate-binding protein n=1 Tax=Gloeocapsopsis dulcis AAB1 = 1H9 TaxID=1433147 RepID=A0A6N8FMW6_9CHRO|nr:iron-siderophore ABC transporter substrate-binding protein [Gloeocapsopsis dulcis]MUL34840.1 ferrichrome ABC transporter substrate-binding protein [Gloeocapsopsis dulcis AAB1 = 1H9]WNN90092.1 iron-siderophore ABC transporter substrate-binding protein [Gloeocapsopsis dulcis]
MPITRRRFLNLSILSAVSVACSEQTLVRTSAIPSNPKVIALEWVYVENLLALGIQPVGVADIAGYNKYVNIAPKLVDSALEVGTRQEPNLEAIAKIKPDLIIGVKQRHEGIYQTLSSIAKTLLFDPYPELNAGNQLAQMQQNFLEIARVCQKNSVGELVLQTMQTTFATAAETLNAVKLTNSPFVLCQFVPEFRLFTNNSMAVQILTQIGLRNIWQGELERFGFNTVGLEALPSIEHAHFFYIAETQAPLQRLQNNAVWQSLDFVREQRLYALGEDTWVFGGPLSAQILAQKAVAALTRSAEQKQS